MDESSCSNYLKILQLLAFQDNYQEKSQIFENYKKHLETKYKQ